MPVMVPTVMPVMVPTVMPVMTPAHLGRHLLRAVLDRGGGTGIAQRYRQCAPGWRDQH
jgi:hypothetical protein